jgi:hypothetical protein
VQRVSLLFAAINEYINEYIMDFAPKAFLVGKELWSGQRYKFIRRATNRMKSQLQRTSKHGNSFVSWCWDCACRKT